MTITIKLLGHASFKIRAENKLIYLDPYGGDISAYDEIADLILVSHKHRDHSDPDKIALIRGDSTKILTPTDNVKNIMGDVESLDPGQKKEFDGVTVYGVPGYNFHRFRSPGEPFHPREIQTAFIIELEGKRIYFAGDTDFVEEMKELKAIDIALLPIGGKYTMDPPEAIDAALAIKPKMVIPMHCREENPEQFKKQLEEKDKKIVVKTLKAGEELTVQLKMIFFQHNPFFFFVGKFEGNSLILSWYFSADMIVDWRMI